MRLSASFIDRISTGRILSRLTTDAGNTQWLMVWGLPTLIVNLLTLIGIGVILFTMDVRLALFVLLPTPVIAYMVYRYRKKSHRIYHRNWRRSADVTSALSDTIPNYMVIKSFAKEDYESDRLDELLNRLYESQVKVTKMNISYWPFLGLLTSLSTVMMWWFGGEQVIAGTIQLGTLTAFVSYMAQFYGPINNLSNIIPFIQQAITSGDRLREIMEAEPDVKEPEHPKKPDLKGDILFSNVWFSYDKYTPVLKNINLRIKVGEKVAVVGKSGSGKTTLSKLLLRMYDVDSGEIKINGVNIKDIDLQYLRERVAYVPQEVALFERARVPLGRFTGSPHLFGLTSVIWRAVGVVRDPPILSSALLSMFSIAIVSLSASRPHLGHLSLRCPASTSLVPHLGHVEDVPAGSTTSIGTPFFSACQSIQYPSLL